MYVYAAPMPPPGDEPGPHDQNEVPGPFAAAATPPDDHDDEHPE